MDHPDGPRAILRALFERALGLGVRDEDDFFDIGGDSLTALHISTQARILGVDISPADLFQLGRIDELAALASLRLANGESAVPEREQDLSPPHDVPLTPAQRHYVERVTPESEHSEWIHYHEILVDSSVDIDQVIRAVHALAERHEALRLRFGRRGGEWVQSVAAPTIDDVAVFLLDGDISDHDLRQLAETSAIKSLDLTHGPLVGVVATKAEQDGRRRCVLFAHHVCVDAVSWLTLLEELDHLCAGGSLDELGAARSFSRWATHVTQEHVGKLALAQLPFWLDQLPERRPTSDSGRSRAGERRVSTTMFVLSTQARADMPSLASGVDAVAGMTRSVEDVLVAAAAEIAAAEQGSRVGYLTREGHGRTGSAVPGGSDVPSNCVGWFTAMYPLAVRLLGEQDSWEDAARRAREAVPGGGVGFGVLEWVVREPTVWSAGRPRISMNFLGQAERFRGRVLNGRPLSTGGVYGGEPTLVDPVNHSIEVDAALVGTDLYVWITHLESASAEVAALMRVLRDSFRLPPAPPAEPSGTSLGAAEPAPPS